MPFQEDMLSKLPRSGALRSWLSCNLKLYTMNTDTVHTRMTGARRRAMEKEDDEICVGVFLMDM